MSDVIQLLPDHVANQIAAGEVVQRPASVVKELLENAIDAKATHIKLIVKDSGRTLIQVVDNGIGMSVTDARLCFERHATSKIKTAEDLFNLHTKGFRGEALASIAAIAHVDVTTKRAQDELATHIKIEGSEVLSQESSAAPEGTSLAVKNLFYNVPARRNFLKSNQVELRHIIDEFQRVALVHPDVRFALFHNGTELFQLPAVPLRQRIVGIFGSKTNEKLVPISENTEIVSISGFIVKPEFSKKTRGSQFFFVNGRYIKSSYLHHAIKSAYEGLLPSGSHPGYFIYLNVPSETIDINIHPTKTEVKFEDEHSLYAILRSTAKHSLGQFNIAPVLDFDRNPSLDTNYSQQNSSPSSPKISVDTSFNPFDNSTSNFPKKPSAEGWEQLYEGLEATTPEKTETIETSLFEESQDRPLATTFQLQRKYIVSTIRSGMVLIHQHRAHQRVLYENFLRLFSSDSAPSQSLLFPLVLSYSKKEVVMLQDFRVTLEHLGFAFGVFEGETIEVLGIHSSLSESDVMEVFDTFLSNLSKDLPDHGFSLNDHFAKILAQCAAIKSGDLLDLPSQEGLVNDLFACKEPDRSPFGKPVFTTLTLDEIEKKLDA